MQFLLTIIVLLALVRSISAQANQPAATGPTATATAATQPVDSVPFKALAHIEKRGSGAISMILIPGLSCDWPFSESFMQRNEDRYAMFAVTLPGFGGSEPPASPPQSAIGLWLDNAAHAVWKLVQDNALDKPI